jgi:hypothetical protein
MLFRWSITANGIYSASSAYNAFFSGIVEAEYADTLGKYAPEGEIFVLVGLTQ